MPQQLPFIEFIFMVGIDLLFIGVLILLMAPLGMYRQAAFAVMKRNFVGYFSNPTGYVFLCLFVLLTALAAFWPHEFFTTNLANFDQLNKFLPYIMLVFIPAITMSIWAEERQQKTDELLLTLPAHDIDIVMGKYFAAVLVFTVSLIFSQLSNYAVLIAMTGGDLDSGLLFSTYLGYWFVGIAMLAIGMVASFLTNNLTVSFIFGVVFNAPLAFFSNADLIFSSTNRWVSTLFDWSLLQRFEPFGRGLISAPSIVFFLGIVAIGVYLSLILIGRRHWLGGRDGNSMLGHFMVRSICLAVFVVAAVLVVQHSPLNQLRLDVSREKISTLSPNTRELLDQIATRLAAGDGEPITVDAYIGSTIPTDFVQTKYDLVNLLREFDVMGGSQVTVNIHNNVEPFSDEAINAEKRFGIRPQKYVSESRGALREDEVILGAAFASGLERVVVEFFSYGMPVEYELIRSINTVSQSNRKTIGIAKTDAFVNGAILNTRQGRSMIPKFQFITELEKQYDIEDVELNEPLALFLESEDLLDEQKFRYDVLLVVQPSKMTPAELEHLIDAIQRGQPTLIFEDPYPFSPVLQQYIAPTAQPRMFARGGTNEMGDIKKLWDALGINIPGEIQSFPLNPNQPNGPKFDAYLADLVWSSYNAYPRDRQLDSKELVIVRDDNQGSTSVFADHPATRGINELLFCFASSVRPKVDSKATFTPLVVAPNVGTIPFLQYSVVTSRNKNNPPQMERQLDMVRGSEDQTLVMAAHITGDTGLAGNSVSTAPTSGEGINCIFVGDLDILADDWVLLRNTPRRGGIEYQIQNLALILNAVDTLAGQDQYIDIRNRRLRHVTLRHVEATTLRAMKQVDEATQNFEKQFATDVNEANAKVESEVQRLETEVRKMTERQQQGQEIDVMALEAKERLLAQVRQEKEQKKNRIIEQLDNARNEQLRSIRLKAELDIQEVQRKYKLAAVLIPPIPPLLLGLIVFTRRRLREREGISRARRLK